MFVESDYIFYAINYSKFGQFNEFTDRFDLLSDTINVQMKPLFLR